MKSIKYFISELTSKYLVAISISLCIFCSYNSAFAQEVSTEGEHTANQVEIDIPIHAKAYGDSIVLRWAPTTPIGWVMGREKGYKIFRMELNKDGSIDTLTLTPVPILPMTPNQLKASGNKDDQYMGLAAQAMYGQNFTMLNPDEQHSEIEKIQSASDMFRMRYYFALQSADLSINAANALGLRYVDKKVEKGKMYDYYVLCDTIDAAYTMTIGHTNVINFYQAYAPQNLKAYASDKQIELQWDRNQLGEFTTYYIERSDDNGKSFKRLNEIPFQSIYQSDSSTDENSPEYKISSILKDYHVYFDTIPKNYFDYQYRIIGIDAFAELSEFSDTLTVHGVDLTAPKPVTIDSISNIKLNHIYLSWVDFNKEPDLKGYYVNRGSDAAGPFYPLHQELLSKDTYSFIDTTADALHPNYYTIVSVDTAQNFSYSIPRRGILTDSIPLSAPEVIKGIMDSVGYIALFWKSSPEPDVKGYSVYISYNQEGPYSIVSRSFVRETYFLDSINTRSRDRKVYYKIVAVDQNGNHSKFSKAIEVIKPIIVPPAAPVNKSIGTKDGAIYSEWIGSESEGVWGYEIYRKLKDNEKWDTLAWIQKDPFNINFYVNDASVVPNVKYAYAASTVDSTGLRSKISFPVWAMNYDIHLLPEISALNAVAVKKENEIQLSWEYTPKNKNYYFVIYKAEGDDPLTEWNSVDKAHLNVNDKDVKKGSTYRYAIEVKQSNGDLKSKRSGEIKIKL
ncbi:MAG: hypothetical protein M9958_10235 [Chitinophagales bacterium]|nr:hypothetical protein [Chitinophagales bacterium]